MAMRKLGPDETTFIGLVLHRISDKIAGIWALDHEFSMSAYNVLNAEIPLGTVVRCTVSPEKNYIIAVEKVDDATYQTYRDNPYVKIARSYVRWRYWHEFTSYIRSCLWRIWYRFRRKD